MNMTIKTIMLMDFLVKAGGPCRLTDICEGVGLNKSTVFRLLSLLEGAGWISKDAPSALYAVGARFTELALKAVPQTNLRIISLPYLYEARDATNETAILTMRVGMERLFLEQVEGRDELHLHYTAELAKRMSLWAGAPGKAILAFMTEEECDAVLHGAEQSAALSPLGRRVDIGAMKADLSQIRKRGFAVSVSERVVGVCGLAAPVFIGDRVIGSISVAGPVDRLTAKTAEAMGPLMASLAKRLTSELNAATGRSEDGGKSLSATIKDGAASGLFGANKPAKDSENPAKGLGRDTEMTKRLRRSSAPMVSSGRNAGERRPRTDIAVG